MRDTSKKLLSVAAAAVLGSTFFLAGCGATAYKGDVLDNYVSEAQVSSNGGFAVQKGDFVYYINGYESNTADNTYGEVEKGALMRISVTDLQNGNYSNVKTVVPSLFVAQDYTSGIYIFDDYVYYATPTTNKNYGTGEASNESLDFKRASIKGDAAPMEDYYFRLKNKASKYRFVKEGNVVYCLYEEDGDLKSFNTSTRKSALLVKDASKYYYDETNLDSPYVYYTMSVADVDKENKNSESYTQLYCVSAAATAMASASKAEITVTIGNGETVKYDFDETYFQEQNKKEKDAGNDEPYDLGDYTTYPYVNLGNLVLDGVGIGNEQTVFNTNGVAGALKSGGYTYTIDSVQNGGVYFTRSGVIQNGSDAGSSELYYLSTVNTSKTDWNAVTGNADATLEVAAPDSTKTADALLYKDASGAHAFLYKQAEGGDTVLKRYAKNELGEYETVTLTGDMADATLWKIVGNTIYYYDTKTSLDESTTTTTNGKNLCMIRFDGTKEDYGIKQDFGGDEASEAFAPAIVPLVDWDSSWYAPEIFGDTVLYVNTQTYGASAYKYIYAAKVDAASVKANAEAVKAVNEEIEKRTNATTKAVLTYYYRTGLTTAYDAVKDKDLYSASQKDSIQAFIDKFTNNELKLENKIISIVGKMTDDDAEAVADEWAATLKKEAAVEEETGLETWVIVLIVVGSVLVVAAAVLIPLLIVAKKKKAAKAEEEATVNAYKRKKIDTTDDKSIDVYADDEANETVEEVQAEDTVEEEKQDE